ncbi:hypothetical protein [Nonomuraea roseoviolacea]|uniref:hypothetical protein n=1 Tax=Nonomuraea roseoviolacea TaxID=103837 RepID=UPI0020A5F3DE|nr:hypothetical protein [Nonomuraea roseoviolacea]
MSLDRGDLALVGAGQRGHLPLGAGTRPLGGLFGLLCVALGGLDARPIRPG